MPQKLGPKTIPRPSTLHLTSHVTELLPPPTVPRELSTPSPVKPKQIPSIEIQNYKNKSTTCSNINKQRHGIPVPIRKKATKLHVDLTEEGSDQDGCRENSVSPAMAPRLKKQPNMNRKVLKQEEKMPLKQPLSRERMCKHKFVNSLNQNIQQSNQLYQQSGFSTRPSTQTARKPSSTMGPQKPIATSKRKISTHEEGRNRNKARQSATVNDENRNVMVQVHGGEVLQSNQIRNDHQPDLLRVGPCHSISQVSVQQLEIDRLERILLDTKREADNLKKSFQNTYEGASVMSIVLLHLSKKNCLQTSSIKNLAKDLQQAELKCKENDCKLHNIQGTLDNERKINESFIEELKQSFELDKSQLKDKHTCEMSILESKLFKTIEENNTKFDLEFSSLKEKVQREKYEVDSKHNETIHRLKSEHNAQQEKDKTMHKTEKDCMESVISDMKHKIMELEETLLNGSDYRVKSAHEKMTNLQQEIDSLKMVVEMRTAEIHDLRSEKIKLEEKLELFDITQVNIKKSQAQVEDLKEQLASKVEFEQELIEENRNLQKLVHKENSEKKRLSMENEQLSWKISQSKESTSSLGDSQYFGGIETSALSMSYCEGTAHSLPFISSPRFFRGAKGGNTPANKLMAEAGILFTDDSFDMTQSLQPDSPRVKEIIEKSDSVSWKLEYETAGSQTSLNSGSMTDGVGTSSACASPIFKRKLSPKSPLLLRKCKSNGSSTMKEKVGLMTRSLEFGQEHSTLSRSNSYSSGCNTTQDGSHAVLQRTASLMQRNGSVRRKIVPSFETLSESTESESDDIKKNSPGEKQDSSHHTDEEASSRNLSTPGPIDIVSTCTSEDDLCDISSSSEIEIGGDEEPTWIVRKTEDDVDSDSEPGSPDTEPEVTLRADLSSSHSKSVGRG